MKNDTLVMKFDQQVDLIIEQKKAEAKAQNRKFRLKKTPEPRSIKPLQRSYIRRLEPMVDYLWEVTKAHIVGPLENIVASSNSTRPVNDSIRSDDYVDLINRALAIARLRFFSQFPKDRIENIAKEQADEINQKNSQDLDRIFTTVLGTNLLRSESYIATELKGFISENVSLIESIPEEYFKQVEGVIYRGIKSGELTPEITKKIRKRFRVTQSRASLIARDQTAKFNSNLTELRHREVGVKLYRWSTSGDERVRPSHREKDGIIYSWDKPPSDTGHVGHDYQCRCSALPIFPED